ncbi:uncharacterized protein LY89DRAFT_713899 [Mollisia scopiformis]|uniref:Uncharacterized protein n=1 Tax=Mollisia scopiformis TaxID=149040 RepID=A0A194XTB1_MOLSC|nr:uncharacterized protein LY89DRAFT_713899 [Mollisia scopiformis]KUJ23443.1 hypothetical protein LY89DRAFT_713899 [Mollisia scopiformis]
MPPKKHLAVSAASNVAKKRKSPPQSSSDGYRPATKRGVKRVKLSDARSIMTQTADSALKNGELDLQSFLKAREFEIKALQNGMQKAKSSLTTRAFQSVPRDMRRRTASHNVKRVPKRLQNKAAREMREDNTPTVRASKREPKNSRGRLRAETAKKLGILAEKKRALKARDPTKAAGVQTRAARPKLRKDMLNDPPKPKSKFRKRQIHKTWLPTHMWHAKRATMTGPKDPLWRFAIPLTPTQKSYRPTHRASVARGAVGWDMSYMSTIGLEGPSLSLEKLLRSVGVVEPGLWDEKATKWRLGKRSWSGWLSREVKDQSILIGPSTILWCPQESRDPCEDIEKEPKKPAMRRVFIRIHPSIFLETWTEVLRLSKLQRPVVHVEDLRFEIGSIEITGPGSTEALLGILHPYHDSDDNQDIHGQTFRTLAGVTNPGSLPLNSILSFPIMDPRLRYPPRPIKLPSVNDEHASFSLLEQLSTWPIDASTGSSALFDRDARFKATRLPSQKSINRRKALAPPGTYPSKVVNDSPIPTMLLTSRASSLAAQGSWTLLVPWKCVLPIWYGLMHYPLSTGGNPRFGGLEEAQQVCFEQGVPWFPSDYPATQAGFAWEAEQRLKRHKDWAKRPKGKRIEWTSLDLGAGRKGEIGRGWACDFEKIIGIEPLPDNDLSNITTTTQDTSKVSEVKTQSKAIEVPIKHMSRKDFTSLISSRDAEPQSTNSVATIRITFLSRGVATPCARIYRLPSSSPSSSDLDLSPPDTQPATTREAWLSLLPQTTNSKPLPKTKGQKLGRIPLDAPLPQRVRLLAQSLLQNPPLQYPADKNGDDHLLVPNEEDLIGFVTTGEFNLAEGKGVAVGSIVRQVKPTLILARPLDFKCCDIKTKSMMHAIVTPMDFSDMIGKEAFMDGLSGAASAFAVVSLAAQVAGGVQKLCNFWETVQDGPRNVSCIVKDLEVVSNVLDDIRQEMLSQNEMPYSRSVAATHGALESCQGRVAALDALIDGFQPGFSTHKRNFKKWAALKASWKGDRLRKFQETLKDVKTTLLLARQNSIARTLGIREHQHRHDLEVLAHGMRLLLTQNDPAMTAMVSRSTIECQEHIDQLKQECHIMSTRVRSSAQNGVRGSTSTSYAPANSAVNPRPDTRLKTLAENMLIVSTSKINFRIESRNIRFEVPFAITNFLGSLLIYNSIYKRASTNLSAENSKVEEGDDETRIGCATQTTVVVHPSWWLSTMGIIWGIQIVLSKSFRGLDCSLRTYFAVPDDSLVFQVCQSGDVAALQELFKSRKASPWDTDSRGYTPLFFAARARQLEICHILINQGADVRARNLMGDAGQTSCREHVDILRLFVDHLDFSDHVNCSGIWGLRRLLMIARCSHISCSHSLDSPLAFLWAFPLLRDDISFKIPAMGRGIAQLLTQAMWLDNVEVLSQIVRAVGDVNSRQILAWFSPAHNLVTSRTGYGIRRTPKSNRFLISQGLDLHLVMDETFEVNQKREHRYDDTPLSRAMRNSESFFLFRELLQDMNISFEDFVEDELRCYPLVRSGWTRTTLLRLFNLEYTPLVMPAITCRTCELSDIATESTWLSLLERLKSMPEAIYNAQEVSLERERKIVDYSDITKIQCCQTTEAHGEEDSMFLFSF